MGYISEAAQVLISILPIVAIIVISVLIFFFLLWRHREIMCQIKTNTYTKHIFNYKVFSLLTGILLTSVGAVLSIVFIIVGKNPYTVLGGLIPLALGIGLLIFYEVIKKNPKF
ncbi:MAG: hypothetical protein IJU92_09495 [Spirochaetaceae bacterium]|nr:hypothetical protein [Spirochaetaceae bacterium]